MCINYKPTPKAQLEEKFSVEPPKSDWPEEAWPDYQAPFIISTARGREAFVGNYGMVPKSHIPADVKKWDTTNARSETVGQLKSYRKSWSKGKLCLIPMMSFFEPNYQSGKSVRWNIALKTGEPFAVAGIWRAWCEDDGAESYSFTQLTVNADEHPFIRQFHKPQDEKRLLVIIPESEYDNWLTCRDSEFARSYLGLPDVAALVGVAMPQKKNVSSQAELFI